MAPRITRDNSIPRKSQRYYLGEAVLRTQFNEIEFYFEDENQQELYFSIMQKLFGENIKFDKVFITCGKPNANKLLDKYRNSKRKIFILDKDFDDLLRKKKRGVNNVFYLSRYSIENFLIEEDALIKLIISRNPILNRNTVNLPYNDLILQTIQELRLLTCYFFVVKKIKLSDYISGFKSCSLSVMRFIDAGSVQISSTRTDAYWQLVEQGITAHLPNKNSSELLESAKRSLKYDSLEINGIFKHIPGKHFLELLRNKITKLYPFMRNEQTGQITFALADKCNLSSLNNLKDDINTYLEAA